MLMMSVRRDRDARAHGRFQKSREVFTLIVGTGVPIIAWLEWLVARNKLLKLLDVALSMPQPKIESPVEPGMFENRHTQNRKEN